MKKALSILLSVMMVAGLFIALIPTASAADMYVVPMPELGDQLYFEDFDDIDDSLEGDELFAALNWYLAYNTDADNDGYGDTRYDYATGMATSDGTTTASVTLGTNVADGSQAISFAWNGTAPVGGHGGWENVVFLADENLAGGNYVIEFDMAADSTHETNETVADHPTLGAATGTGASFGPMATTKYSTASKSTTYWHYGIKSRGNTDIHCSYAGGTNGGKAYGSADYYTGTMYADTTAVNKMDKFRIVVDATYGISAWTSDDNGVTWTQTDSMTEAHAADFSKNAPFIGKELRMRSTGGMDVTFDNMSVWTIAGREKVTVPGHLNVTDTPELVISEVTTSAWADTSSDMVWTPAADSGIPTATGGKGGQYAVDENGNYLVPEAGQGDGTKESGRWEYLEVYNSGNETVDLSDYSISSWSYKQNIGESTLSCLSRIHKGLKVVTDNADGLTWQFYNDPDDCILEPGEAAILFMPNNWFYSSPTFCHVNAFKEQILKTQYGMTDEQIENAKILTLYDSLDELYAMYGKSNYTVINGMGINNSGNSLLAVVKDAEEGALPYTYTEGKCYMKTLGDSLISYVLDSQNGTASYILVGDMATGSSHQGYSMKSGFAAQYDYWTDNGEYIIGGKVDISRKPSLEDPTTRTFGYVPEDLQVVYAREKAEWTGWQAAEDGDVRLIAEIADITDVFAIGFEIYLPGMMEDEETGEPFTKTVYVEYVYNKLTTNFGTEDLGFKYADSNYFVALEVVGAAVNEFPTEFEVKMVTVYDDGKVITTKPVTFTAEYIVEA